MGTNSETPIIYESWNLDGPSFRKRSTLYSMEPVGIGTGSIESLTSYVARLAAEHSLTPALLLDRLVASQIGKGYWFHGGARAETNGSALGNSFREHSKAINGIGVISNDWVAALENLTLRNDLRFLTMIPWANAFTQRNLLKPSRAWCPNCFEDWQLNNNTVYEPLLWTFRDVRMCLRHQRQLSSQCNHCGRSLPWLGRLGQPGYCSKCGDWLGIGLDEPSRNTEISASELEWQTFVAENLEQTISAARHFPAPSKERTSTALSHCIDQTSEGVMNQFAGLVGKRKNTVWGWQHGKAQIPIDDLLRICYRIGICLVDFLYAGSFLTNHIESMSPTVLVSGVKPKRRAPRALEREKTEQLLRAMLKNQIPLSMKVVASRLNRNKRFLYKHFPELCKSISTRRANYQQILYTNRQNRYQEAIEQTKFRLRSSGVHPSRRLVARLMRTPEKAPEDSSDSGIAIRDWQIAA
jgi:hypothetical protein